MWATDAAAPNPGFMIATRLGQGVGTAMMTATAIALVLPQFPADRRGLAIGIWGTIGSLGAAVGPTLGAAAIELQGWRLGFMLSLPIAALTLTLGRRMLAPDPPRPADARSVDFAGASLGSFAVALLTLAILQGGTWGWTSGGVIATLAAAIACAFAFRQRCARVANPILDLGLFRHRQIGRAHV